ncbi:unnamed protein product [Parascedosporium putredinis]|uniref:Uncharacterized protein n=1 Tax=Parascedosporium putredinis TaxID=1442378 RepID=A0A9P1H7F8_9PEZI|nr:unnamed protein product [Parascedosporium putredinis]CAI7999629.1 unnamed protein product [Parascedosporium putredinis]
MVTVLDSSHGLEYGETVKENRKSYAKLHGYETFFAHVGDYDLLGSPMSWTKIVAMRHALNKFPNCQYIWFLTQDAFIMNPAVSIHKDIMASDKLENLMIRNQPVALPDSIIKTYSHLKPENVDVVVTQDFEGMSADSLIIRNSEWAEFFLDSWYDPLYRSYNFQKAETHALEHIAQWHPTILSKLALVPQSTLNSYSRATLGAKYSTGDFVVRFAGCTKMGNTACHQEAGRYNELRRNAFANA